MLVVDAQQPDPEILERGDVIRERASEAKRSSSVNLRVEDVDVVAEPAKHDGERAVLRSYTAVIERSLKFASYNADFFSRFWFGDLRATQLTLRYNPVHPSRPLTRSINRLRAGCGHIRWLYASIMRELPRTTIGCPSYNERENRSNQRKQLR